MGVVGFYRETSAGCLSRLVRWRRGERLGVIRSDEFIFSIFAIGREKVWRGQ